MTFYKLNRIQDISGVSGTGNVATIIDIGAGAVILWDTLNTLSGVASLAIYKSLKELESIHSHGGASKLVEFTPTKEEVTFLIDDFVVRKKILDSVFYAAFELNYEGLKQKGI